MWRAWLLFEDLALTSNHYQSDTIGGSPVMSHLECAGDLLWAYLDRNAAAIGKDPRRRHWWVSQLTRDLEAPGGSPARCWFLLQLVAAADPGRAELEAAPIPEKFVPAVGGRGQVRVRQPHPLDPFLLRSDLPGPLPPFAETLWRIAAPLGLKLTVLGADPETMPPTHTEEIISRHEKWAMPDLAVINQESWSKEPSHGYTWGVSFFRPVGRRDAFASVSFPGLRSDGVYFFVFKKRLHVWPKAKMDAAVLALLQSAGLADDALKADWKQRGLVPLEVTLAREE